MRPRVLVAEPTRFSERALEVLRARADVEVRAVDGSGLVEALDAFDVVWLRLGHRVTAEAILGSKRCKVLAVAATGTDHLDAEACRVRGIRIVSLKGETAFLKQVRATAEHTVGLMLALLRHLPEAAESVRAGEWQRDRFQGGELHGKTVGLVGVGRLGSLVAGYLTAFGCEVLGFDRRSDWPAGVERVADLHALLSRADLVSVHVTFDESTRGLIDARAFAAMKPGAYFINTARGGIVDEVALLGALESGRVAGAALDVLTGEPDVDGSHPVVQYARAHRNLLVVPHLGGNTRESFEKTEVFLAGRVLEALS